MDIRLCLISYDIASPKRWRRVQKILRPLCERQQLSVFVCRGSATRIATLERAMRKAMNLDRDRLIVLDLGPAETAGPKLKALNSMTRIADLEGVVL